MCTEKWSASSPRSGRNAPKDGRADWHPRCYRRVGVGAALQTRPTPPLTEVETMSRRFLLALVLVCTSFALFAQPASAQQTFNVSLGYFTPRGQDARVAGDVLSANRNFLEFAVKDFNGASIGGQWLFPVGRYIEAVVCVYFSRNNWMVQVVALFNLSADVIYTVLLLHITTVHLLRSPPPTKPVPGSRTGP